MKENKVKRGAPTKPLKEKKNKRLPVVQLTEEQLKNYSDAAILEDMTNSEWVRVHLDKAAKVTLKKHED